MPGPGRSVERRATALVFLAALFYFLLFHRYGFFLQDEGVNAYGVMRILQGQIPYRDFQTAYPPASYYLHAVLFRLFGPGLPVLRVAASFACAGTAAVLFLVATEVLSTPWAFLPSLLYVILEDQESRGFVVHTIAYPARYVTLLWVLGAWLAMRHARTPRRSLVVALGFVTAAILSFKHTAGIYDAWAAGVCVVVNGLRLGVDAPPGPVALAPLPAIFLLLVLAGFPLLFGSFTGLSVLAFVSVFVPVVVAVLMIVRDVDPRPRDRRPVLGRIGADLLWFSAAALVPTMAWVTGFAVAAGPHTLLQRLVLDGSRVARSYAIGFPPPGSLSVLFFVIVAVTLGARVLFARGLVDRERGARMLVATLAGLTVFTLFGSISLVRETLRMKDWELGIMHVGRGVDNVLFYVIPVIAYAFLPTLAARKRTDENHLVVVCWLQALFQLLLVYPRFDVAHLYEGTVLLLVPGIVLLQRAVGFFGVGAGTRWLRTAVAVALVVVVTVKLVPRVRAQVTWEDGPALPWRMTVDGPRGGLYETGPQGGWLAALNRTVVLVRERTTPDTPIFGFPALPGLYFLTERNNPTAFDYFYQGFGEGTDELGIVTELEARRVPLVVTVEDETYDQRDRGYYPILKDYLRLHFRQTQEFPPFKVLERVVP
jgi:hypothetical protein